MKLLLVLAVACLLLLSACRSAATRTYRLVPGDTPILIPPGVPAVDSKPRTVRFQSSVASSACSTTDDIVQLRRRGRTLQASPQRERLEKAEAGALIEFAKRLELDRCLAPGEALPFSESIVRSLPLSLPRSHDLLHAPLANLGYMDLRPGYRLRIVSPVFRDGAPADAQAIEGPTAVKEEKGALVIEAKASADLIGYETAWYSVEPRPNHPGVSIRPGTTDVHIDGKLQKEPASRFQYFAFPPNMSLFRLLFITRSSDSDRDSLLLGADTEETLARETKRLNADPKLCASLETSSRCFVMPRQAALSGLVSITVNGEPTAVLPGTTIGQLLLQSNLSPDTWAQILATLQVNKPYRSELAPVIFPRTSRHILSLPLSGGEQISW